MAHLSGRWRQKDVAGEPGFLLNFEDARPHILGQVFEFRDWVAADPRRGHADGTLVPPDRVKFPPIPENSYGDVKRPMVHAFGVNDPLHVLDFGPQFKPADSSGIITKEPPGVSTASYTLLVPQVDDDGNDKAGIRSVMLRVPIGTYTGWNLGRKGRFEYEFCSLTGSFIPFARTREERIATGDPRHSIEERYPSKEAYVAAVKKTAEDLQAKRYLLPDDAAMLIDQAEAGGIRSAP